MSAGTRCWLQAVARLAICQELPDALRTRIASIPGWRVTPAQAHGPEQPKPLTEMSPSFGVAEIPAVMAAWVHGGPGTVVVVAGGGAVVVVVVVVTGAAEGGDVHPARTSGMAMPSAATKRRPGRRRLMVGTWTPWCSGTYRMHMVRRDLLRCPGMSASGPNGLHRAAL